MPTPPIYEHSDLCTVVHVIGACFIGFNSILVTWLTRRAKRKDREYHARIQRFR